MSNLTFMAVRRFHRIYFQELIRKSWERGAAGADWKIQITLRDGFGREII